jgi:hypothetical protein
MTEFGVFTQSSVVAEPLLGPRTAIGTTPRASLNRVPVSRPQRAAWMINPQMTEPWLTENGDVRRII